MAPNPNPPDQKTISTDKARQGRPGSQVLIVLVVALVLAMVAWYAAETYGEATDPPANAQTEPSG
jgi:hypothetical protein